jgi:hypothetical protein
VGGRGGAPAAADVATSGRAVRRRGGRARRPAACGWRAGRSTTRSGWPSRRRR